MNKNVIEEKIVYNLAKYLVDHPEEVSTIQSLTLNPSKPEAGLLGENGLYGSEKWWESIKSGAIEIRTYRGTIQQLYVAGQDTEDDEEGKDFEYLCDDGKIRKESCMANEESDLNLYQAGAKVRLIYALDKLKKQPAKTGNINFAEILLEISIY